MFVGAWGAVCADAVKSPEEGVQSGGSSGKIQNKETPEKSSSADKVPQNGMQSNSMRPGCWEPNLRALSTTELSLQPPKNKIAFEDETCDR